jgi:hypothetical protein
MQSINLLKNRQLRCCLARGVGTFSNRPVSIWLRWTTPRGGVSALHSILHRNRPLNLLNCPLPAYAGRKSRRGCASQPADSPHRDAALRKSRRVALAASLGGAFLWRGGAFLHTPPPVRATPSPASRPPTSAGGPAARRTARPSTPPRTAAAIHTPAPGPSVPGGTRPGIAASSRTAVRLHTASYALVGSASPRVVQSASSLPEPVSAGHPGSARTSRNAGPSPCPDPTDGRTPLVRWSGRYRPW